MLFLKALVQKMRWALPFSHLASLRRRPASFAIHLPQLEVESQQGMRRSSILQSLQTFSHKTITPSLDRHDHCIGMIS